MELMVAEMDVMALGDQTRRFLSQSVPVIYKIDPDGNRSFLNECNDSWKQILVAKRWQRRQR